MRLYVEDGDLARAVAVSINDQEATIRELAEALGFGSVAGLAVDDVLHGPDVLLRNVMLVSGAKIAARSDVSNASDTDLSSGDSDQTWVGVVGGPGTGSLVRVNGNCSVAVGRGENSDLMVQNETVSSSHALVMIEDGEIVVEDLDSHNGTWISGQAVSGKQRLSAGASVRLGSSLLRVDEVDRGDRPVGTAAQHADETGRVLFNRPPRAPVLREPDAVELPEPAATRSNPTLAIVSLIAPLVLAGAMVFMLGSWRYALFGLLSPVMTFGNWFAKRRQVNRQRTLDQTTQRAEMSRLREDLDSAQDAERARRSAFGPDLLEIRRRIELPSSRLWERRHGDADAMTVRIGYGSAAWTLPVVRSREGVPADVDAMLSARKELRETEVLVDLRSGPLGIVGDGHRTSAAARAAVLQLATHHGPADLQIAVLTTVDLLGSWDWATWLPHCTGGSEGSGRPFILAGDASAAFASSLLDDLSSAGSDDSHSHPSWLVVVDDVSLLHGRSSAARRLFEPGSKRAFGIVLADTVDQLPASVATVVQADASDEFNLTEPASPRNTSTGILDSVTTSVARDLARSMARFEDPEVELATGQLPVTVRAAETFGDGITAAEIRRRWERSKDQPGLRTPIGQGEYGLMSLDLVGDGPHALVAGTTGAGKSEFLRTLIIGLSSNHDPEDLVFVLIDYKGGSAFDSCAGLPHVVGVVTDLDEHLAGRALQSLDAELRYRETSFREAEARDIDEYHLVGLEREPIPRLVVVIDEFAALRSELPEFVTALVGIAQRGRSLGVHLVLATQRPSGAVDSNIRANTNLRVCLRVQDAADSHDVIDSPLGAQISRASPGRAFVRRGEGELLAVQTTYVSGSTATTGPRVRAAEISLGGGEVLRFKEAMTIDGETELDGLVVAVVDAAKNHQRPRRPWLEPLPSSFSSVEVESMKLLPVGDSSQLQFAIGDDPVNQRRVALGWNPDDGNLGVFGVLGSGVSTTLRSVVTLLGTPALGKDVWVFACDHAAGGLRGLDGLAHVACCLEASEIERRDHLLTFLAEELDRRRGLSPSAVRALPLIVLAVDGVGAFCESLGILPGTANGDVLARLARDGAGSGIVCILGARSLDEVPRGLRTSIRKHVVLEQASPDDYASFGIRTRDLPSFVPGRAIVGTEAFVAQIVDFHDGIDHVALRIGLAPPPIEALPERLERAELATGSIDPHLSVPIGIAARTREQAELTFRSGEHGFIAGPPGSGRTSALRLIAEQVRDAAPDFVIVGVAPQSDAELFVSPVFDAGGSFSDVQHVLRMAFDDPRRWLILVDDADRIDIEPGPLLELSTKSPHHVTILAATRSSAAHQDYGHWTRALRTSGNGILLQPEIHDGELFGLRLPRGERLRAVPGRGYVVNGSTVTAVQLAH